MDVICYGIVWVQISQVFIHFFQVRRLELHFPKLFFLWHFTLVHMSSQGVTVPDPQLLHVPSFPEPHVSNDPFSELDVPQLPDPEFQLSSSEFQVPLPELQFSNSELQVSLPDGECTTFKLRSINQTLIKKGKAVTDPAIISWTKTCPFIQTARSTVFFDEKTPPNDKIKETFWTHVAVKNVFV